MKRLFIDIETSPNVVTSWRIGSRIYLDQKNILKERAIICICFKWENERTVKFLKWDKDQSDKKMVEMMLPFLNSADEVCGHNIEKFDIPWIKTRAIFYGLVTNPHWKIVDTCTFAQKRLYLNSNKLDYLGNYLGLGRKIKTEFELWKDVVLKNDAKALNKMIKYCKRDVVLVEAVYKKLADHMEAKTHVGVLNGNEKWTCSKCGSLDVNVSHERVSAMGVMRVQMKCNRCGHFYTVSTKAREEYSGYKKKLADYEKKKRENQSTKLVS
jgi:RNase P subunit RPR2